MRSDYKSGRLQVAGSLGQYRPKWLLLLAMLMIGLGNVPAQGQRAADANPPGSPPVAPGTGLSLVVPRVVLGAPGGVTHLAIQILEPSALPPRSYLRVRGLPESIALSEGHQVTPGSWSVPIAGAADLRLLFASGSNGKSDVTVALVSIDQGVIAEAKTMVVVAAAAFAGAPESRAGAAVLGSPSTPSAPVGPSSAPVFVPPVMPPQVMLPTPDAGGAPRSLRPTAPSPPPPVPPSAIPPVAALPPQTATPPAPVRPQISSADRQQAESHFGRGIAKLKEGDVASARLFFRRAADAGLGEAALAMGQTYDSVELARLRIVSIAPDPSEARRWYQKAVELGARTEAGPLLDRLGR